MIITRPIYVHDPQTTITNEGTYSITFYSNFEAKASELLENRQEMFPQYYIRSMFFNNNVVCYSSQKGFGALTKM